MLLDPFEEQLHLPATAVQLCDPQGWQCGVVGEKFQSFVALFVMILDAPEFFRIVVRSFHTSEPHGLIADHTGATVNRVGVKLFARWYWIWIEARRNCQADAVGKGG